MALRNVLIVNKTFPAAGIELLKKSRVVVTLLPHLDFEPESLPAIEKELKEKKYDAVIWNTKHRLTGPRLDLAGPKLKYVTTMSSGLDHVDVDELRRRDVRLGNTPQVLDDAVADIAVGLLIAAARGFKGGIAELERVFINENMNPLHGYCIAWSTDKIILDAHNPHHSLDLTVETPSGAWKAGVQWRLGQDIVGSTVGIVGLGGVGQAVVRRLKGFDVKRFVYSGRNDKPEAKALGAERVSIELLLKESDFVVLCCPLTNETKHLINDQTLSIMKKNAVLVNIARGGVIDQAALHKALTGKRIFAAGLDVTTPEPLPKDDPLISLPNCFIVPHLGSATYETRNKMARISANNVLLALEGKPMLHPIV